MEKLNYYKNTQSPIILSATTSTNWFELIKQSDFSNLISKARTGELDYEDVKLYKVPCVTYNFLFEIKKENKNIIGQTGLMYLDIDNPSFDPRTIDRSKIYTMYNSFGGYGWSIVVRIDGLTKNNFATNYSFVAKELGIESYVDNGAKKASQYNVLSFDPNIQVNPNPFVFKAVEVINTKESVPTSVRNRKKEEKAYTPDVGTLLPLRFDNLGDIEFEGDYIVNWEGYDLIKCWIPIKKKSSGRNNLLLSYLNNLLYLNPHLTKERAYEVISAVNNIAFISPSESAQLQKIIQSVFRYRDEGTLKPIYFRKKRKIVFAKKTNLTKEDKLDICRDEMAKHRRENSKKKIYDIIESWNFELNGKISIRKIAKFNSVNVKTVTKYWSEFKEYVNQINNK